MQYLQIAKTSLNPYSFHFYAEVLWKSWEKVKQFCGRNYPVPMTIRCIDNNKLGALLKAEESRRTILDTICQNVWVEYQPATERIAGQIYFCVKRGKAK